MGRQQLRLFDDRRAETTSSTDAYSIDSIPYVDRLSKLESLGTSLLNSDIVGITKYDVWLTSWPEDACGWGTDAFLFPQERFRFLIFGNKKQTKHLVKQIRQDLPSEQQDAVPMPPIDIRHIDTDHSQLSQVAENGHYCHLISKHHEGIAFGSEYVKTIDLVTSRPLVCREMLFHPTSRLGIELNFLTSPPFTYGPPMSWLTNQYDAVWHQATRVD